MSPADPTTDAQQLQARLVAFIRAFGLHQPDTTPCGKPIPVSEAHALMELARDHDQDQPLGQHELARRLRLQKSTVSRLVTQLTQRGWVERERDPDDGRATLLRLTAAGQTAAGELAAARTATFNRLLDAIPTPERDNVLRALHVLTEALHDRRA
jgi:DNA-binding MarR family transcriptional regulator